MRVLVCGSRHWPMDRPETWGPIRAAIDALPADAVVIHGAAPGVDTIAGRLAKARGLAVVSFPAHWRHLPACPVGCARVTGPAAGPVRNRQMLATAPDLVLAFHDNLEASRGTRDCVTEARRRGIEVRVAGSEEASAHHRR